MAHMGGIERDMVVLQSLITDLRTIRAEVKIETKQKAPAEVFTNSKTTRKVFEQNLHIIEKLANVSELRFIERSLAEKANSHVNPQYEVHLVYEHKVDPAVEHERLTKELKDLETQLGNARAKLANENFLSKASVELVEGTKKRESELVEMIAKVKSALEKV
jgi:valyl-tRNA synthetase